VRFEIRVVSRARRDLARLQAFLAAENRAAAGTAADILHASLETLQTLPHRGRPAFDGHRELFIPFGRGGYIVLYRVDEKVVVVAKITHTRERR
jgi:plasmid stabilization system protein ParE